MPCQPRGTKDKVESLENGTGYTSIHNAKGERANKITKYTLIQRATKDSVQPSKSEQQEKKKKQRRNREESQERNREKNRRVQGRLQKRCCNSRGKGSEGCAQEGGKRALECVENVVGIPWK